MLEKQAGSVVLRVFFFTAVKRFDLRRHKTGSGCEIALADGLSSGSPQYRRNGKSTAAGVWADAASKGIGHAVVSRPAKRERTTLPP